MLKYVNYWNIICTYHSPPRTIPYDTLHPQVMIWDDHQNRCIGELMFKSEVKAVKLRRDRVVVVLKTKVGVRDRECGGQ